MIVVCNELLQVQEVKRFSTQFLSEARFSSKNRQQDVIFLSLSLSLLLFVLHIYVYGSCLGPNPIKLNLFISLIDQVIDFFGGN